jgi:hypothetical protein
MDLRPLVDQGICRTITTRSAPTMGLWRLAILHFDSIDLGIVLTVLWAVDSFG